MGLKTNCPICLENIQSLNPNETVPIYHNLHPVKYSHTLQHLVLHTFKDWPEHTHLCRVFMYLYLYINTLLYLIRETTPPVHDKHHSCSRYKMRRAAPAAYLLMQTEKFHHVKVKSPHCVFGDTSWECNEANICKIFFTFSVKRIFSTVQEVFYWLCSASLVFCLSHHSWQLSSLISPSLSFQSNFEISGL